MISIKKYLDTTIRKINGEILEPFGAAVDVYRSGLVAVAKATALDGSPHGIELGNRLVGLDQRMGVNPTIKEIKQSEIDLEANLAIWGKRAASERSAINKEMKELILALAKTAEAVSARNQQHNEKFGTITENLESIGSIEGITEVRKAILSRVAELRSTVEELSHANHELVSELQNKVTTFETRLKSVENLAFADSLTGAANRRCLEDRINYNIGSQVQFCVVLFDLNRFKAVNDTFGHNAGDDLLRQFAEKLKLNSRSSDLIGRWGGDEFMLVLSGSEKKIITQVRRLQREVCTRYMLHGSGGFLSTLDIEAAVGVAQWRPEESLKEVVARADENMYIDKHRLKNGGLVERESHAVVT